MALSQERERERVSVCMHVCNKAEWDFAAHPHGSIGVREKKREEKQKTAAFSPKTLANTFIPVDINHSGP